MLRYAKKRLLYIAISFYTIFGSFFMFQFALPEVNNENDWGKKYTIKILNNIYSHDYAFKYLFPIEQNYVTWERRSKKTSENTLENIGLTDYVEYKKSMSERIEFQNKLSYTHSEASMTERMLGQRVIEENLKSSIPRNQLSKPKQKIILLYYNDKLLSNQVYEKQKCAVNNCHISRKAADFENADVVIFKRIPPDLQRPVSRPNQLWIYLSLESPFHTRPFPHHVKVNYTATYRSDSIIPVPYGIFKNFDHSGRNKESISYNIAHAHHVSINSKTKLIAWFASNCFDKNGRLEYVNKLQNYIKVDIYGRCGPLVCKKDGENTCHKMLQKEYKFYLAFENSNCIEYITEKFFKALRYDVIPVVMGARIYDYERIAPPNSFIHVDQFSGPEQLAKYLLKLHNNKDLYMNYFSWKSKGDLELDLKYQCRLCSVIQLAEVYNFWYKDVNLWWNNGTCVGPARKKTWNSWNTDQLTDIKYLPKIFD